MPDAPAAFLKLLWLASPALPVGGFSYSEGLEAAVDQGMVADEASARAWLLDQLTLGAARSEWPAMVASHRAWIAGDLARIEALNDWLAQTRESAEFALQMAQMGRSMLPWLRHAWPEGDARIDALAPLQPAPQWPVAWALAAALADADERSALLAFAFGWCEGLVQAAMKAVPLGQAAGQRLLAALADAIPACAEAALDTPDEDRIAFLPGLAIASARHETQYSRLFRS